VTKEIGIPKPIIILLNRGFKPCVVANILAVIMGAIADSIMATSIILNFDSKSQHTINKLWLASKLAYTTTKSQSQC
jgi:hypothetical protein